ncbi:hypothetical protein BO83DRAFT_88271 [Aspergillus eucalypticola CBS 122712]|uniref:Uncharacterized protein n=1 Tax=Aspergillus eucalypticola (strain CBS 122712 / IBT 29274) TaxID=1448314 RepID=A0A317V5M6_ASPEC|nr:uncharacterized protein BO83DRAFT_88271 [Aspergillus eucalypticola CBS 122712]PWY68207.1 hypothetical protein BO83DRAFT_88271 [Aspergillus eucalypticola CBS 122712]
MGYVDTRRVSAGSNTILSYHILSFPVCLVFHTFSTLEYKIISMELHRLGVSLASNCGLLESGCVWFISVGFTVFWLMGRDY